MGTRRYHFILPSPTDLAAACTFPAVVQARARGADMPLPLQPGKHQLHWGDEAACTHEARAALCAWPRATAAHATVHISQPCLLCPWTRWPVARRPGFLLNFFQSSLSALLLPAAANDELAAAFTAPPSVLDSSDHLLHGVVHVNGFGHLLRINGLEGGSKLLTGGV